MSFKYYVKITIKLTVSSFSFFVPIHSAFVCADSNSSISVTFRFRYTFTWTFFLTMIDNMTSQNFDLFSWITLYECNIKMNLEEMDRKNVKLVLLRKDWSYVILYDRILVRLSVAKGRRLAAMFWTQCLCVQVLRLKTPRKRKKRTNPHSSAVARAAVRTEALTTTPISPWCSDSTLVLVEEDMATGKMELLTILERPLPLRTASALGEVLWQLVMRLRTEVLTSRLRVTGEMGKLAYSRSVQVGKAGITDMVQNSYRT